MPAIAANSRIRPDPYTGLTDQIDLRGLGSTQAQILVDGRRISGRSLGGNASQPDIESIPLSAIERIELRQGTGSAVFGAGTAGGVINVVRRECCDREVQLDYGDSFSSGSRARRAFLTQCASWNEGRTRLLLFGADAEEEHFWRRIAPLSPPVAMSCGGATRVFRRRCHRPWGASQHPHARWLGSMGPENPAIANIPIGYRFSDGVSPLLANAGRYDLSLAPTAQTDGEERSAPQRSLNALSKRILASYRLQWIQHLCRCDARSIFGEHARERCRLRRL